jgi:hypothetical protein
LVVTQLLARSILVHHPNFLSTSLLVDSIRLIQKVVRIFEAAQRKPLDPEKMTKLLLWIRKNPRLGKPLKELLPALQFLGWRVEPLPTTSIGAKFVSPKGDTFEGGDFFFDFMSKEYPFSIKNSDGLTLEKWLAQNHFQDQVLEELKMESLDSEKARRTQEKDEKARVGKATCSCCFGPFMLLPKARKGDKSMPGIVLHGYRRPGRGYLEGECFGQGWPPFELSSEGTGAYLKHLEGLLEDLEKGLGRLERGEEETLFFGLKAYQRKDPTPEVWSKYLERALDQQRSHLQEVTRVRNLVQKKLASWEPHPEKLELKR